MKIEIEVPNPPEGWEIYGYGKPQQGDKVHDAGGWSSVCPGHLLADCYILARKKRTIADWANEQPLFQVMAKMRAKRVHGTKAEYVLEEASWLVAGSYFELETPPKGMGLTSLRLVNGKWELA